MNTGLSSALVGEAWLLGLSMGTVCVTTCAPSAVPLFLSRQCSFRRNAAGAGLFFAGRLAGYLLIGLLLGWLGGYAAGYIRPVWESRISGTAYLVTGVLLLMEGLFWNVPRLGLCRWMGMRYPWTGSLFLFGLFTGLHFCPPFFAATLRVLEGAGGSPALSGALAGAGYFLFFFLGTSIYFLPLLAAPALTRRREVRLVARMTLILMGAYFLVVLGIFRLGGMTS